ncbi:MAG: NADPH-dependent FMN reductase, partial [Bdellovibrionales bacterium]|nr:NADPH-dependent FMN reductase [Bdellovibrionales bacterium]
EMIYSGTQGSIGRYIGYYGPYATSHDALDGDEKIQQEVRVSALSLASAVRANRLNLLAGLQPDLKEPRPK